MKLMKYLKGRAKFLKLEITAVFYAYQNKNLGLRPKIIILLTLGYALSPIDLIPDFIPIIGYLDDLIILPALIALSIKLIPDNIMEESRNRAVREPILLKKNWYFALFIFSIWGFIWFLIINFIYQILKKSPLKIHFR